MKLAWIFLFGFVLVGCATDQRYLVKKPFLYEISKDNKKAYLFGTMHIGVLSDDLPEKFWPYFDSSDIVVLESDAIDTKKFEGELVKRGLRRGDEPKASEVLTPDEFQKLSQLTARALSGLKIDDVSLWALNSIVMQENSGEYILTHGESMRYTGKFILDAQLEKKATNSKKTQMTLDNVESDFLMNCVLGEPADQLKDLRDTLAGKNQKDLLQFYENIAATYRNGDEKKILSSIKENERLSERLMGCVLQGRHELWMSKLMTALEHYERPFIAVGAAHVIDYPGSVSQRLQGLGYKVRRMSELDLPTQQ